LVRAGARTPSGASSESLPSSSSFGSGADVLDVRIVIGGGNNLMHNFLCGLVSLMQVSLCTCDDALMSTLWP